jgi:hypothetical protein
VCVQNVYSLLSSSMALSLSTLAECFPNMVVKGMRGTTGDNGMTPFVYASWLQKSIRRGLVAQAVYAVAGLYSFGIQDKGKPILTFLNNRLIIIALEDVGLAHPFLVDEIILRIHGYEDKPASLEAFYALAGIAKKLCEAPKTRLSSWLKNACARDTVSCDLGPYASIQWIFSCSPRSLVARKIGKGLFMLNNWIYDTKNISRPEWIYGLTLALLRPEKYQFVAVPPYTCDTEIMRWHAGNGEVLAGEFASVVLDIHTGKRKRSDPDALFDFAIRGAHIENELVLHPCHETLKAFYNECKRTNTGGVYPPKDAAVQEPVKKTMQQPVPFSFKDSDLFTPYGSLIGFKKPTFFATRKSDGSQAFVKLVKPGLTKFAMKCHEYRKMLGLYTVPSADSTDVLVTYDYSAMAVPAKKQKCEETMKSLLSVRNGLVDVLITDKAEGGVPLFLAIKLNRYIDKLALLKVLLFRRFVQTTDTNTLNIVITLKGEVLSVDENSPDKVQRKRWLERTDPNTVFNAKAQGGFTNDYYSQLKAFSAAHESELVDFLKVMRETVYDISRDVAWIDRMLVSKNWM